MKEKLTGKILLWQQTDILNFISSTRQSVLVNIRVNYVTLANHEFKESIHLNYDAALWGNQTPTFHSNVLS